METYQHSPYVPLLSVSLNDQIMPTRGGSFDSAHKGNKALASEMQPDKILISLFKDTYRYSPSISTLRARLHDSITLTRGNSPDSIL